MAVRRDKLCVVSIRVNNDQDCRGREMMDGNYNNQPGVVRHDQVEGYLQSQNTGGYGGPSATSPTAYGGTVAANYDQSQAYPQPAYNAPPQQAQPAQQAAPRSYEYADETPREEGLPAPPTYEHEPVMQVW